jgi:hypothetical protein
MRGSSPFPERLVIPQPLWIEAAYFWMARVEGVIERMRARRHSARAGSAIA